jgi:hypothetical protein
MIGGIEKRSCFWAFPFVYHSPFHLLYAGKLLLDRYKITSVILNLLCRSTAYKHGQRVRGAIPIK